MVDRVLKIVGDVGVVLRRRHPQPILDQLTKAPAAGFALVFGLLLALWSASGYVAAFSRGMNRVYEIDEGRPIWKLRPALLLVTLVLVVIAVVVVAAVVLSGGVARSIGETIGLSDVTVTVWNIVKWPVILALVVVAVAILYHSTPNVRQPKFRWISLGAVVAIVVWVARVGRVRVLRRATSAATTRPTARWPASSCCCSGCGSPTWPSCSAPSWTPSSSEDASCRAASRPRRPIQLPPRDTRASEKKQAKQEEDERRGRALRQSRGTDPDSDER